jgi:hypothetical protein
MRKGLWFLAGLVCACSPVTRDDGAFLSDGAGTDALPGTSGDDGGSNDGGDSGSDDDGGSPLKLDVGADPEGGGPMGCVGEPPGGDALLRGRVFAPNGEVPISGALVWVQPDMPEGIPDHVYCESCIELPCDSPHGFTGPDGTFEFDLPPGPHHLVVQKGQFMRATEITVTTGSNEATLDATTLPSTRDEASGRWIPNIALGWGEYDRLEDGLAKLGLAQTNGGTTMVPGTEAFDIYSNGQGAPTVSGTFGELLLDPEAMAKYHIIFVPCTSSPHEQLLNDPQVLSNIRSWVEAGGKWYVSDWSLDFLNRPFPQYQTFHQDKFTGGPFLDEFDSTGTVLDDDLLAWLGALPPALKDINPDNPGDGGGHPTVSGLPNIELVDLWSTIKATPPVWTDDGNGGQVDVGHKTWIEAPGGGGDGAPANHNWPMTVAGEYGCGRMMFTSYHTVEWTDAYRGLTPQELVLAYLILEIGVCQVPYVPPPVG